MATFTDSGGAKTESEYAALVNWGDGITTAGQVTGSDGSFVVTDNTDHILVNAGTYPVSVTVFDDEGSSATAEPESVTITSEEALYGGAATSDAVLSPLTGLQATENTPFSGLEVASFTCASYYTGPFAALITWETPDGTPHNSTGTVTYSNGHGTITGGYTYFDQPGSYPMSVTLSDLAGEVATTTDQSMTVVPGTLSVTTLPLAIDDLNNGSVVEVATFTDTDPAAVSSEYGALLSSNLGTSTCEVVPDPTVLGQFDVYASLSAAFTGSTSAISLTRCHSLYRFCLRDYASKVRNKSQLNLRQRPGIIKRFGYDNTFALTMQSLLEGKPLLAA